MVEIANFQQQQQTKSRGKEENKWCNPNKRKQKKKRKRKQMVQSSEPVTATVHVPNIELCRRI